MFRVYIEELEFYAYHGVSKEEQAVGHRYVASVSLLVNGDADETDSIDGTVDYGEAAELILRVVTLTNFHTLERLGNEIIKELLAKYPCIEEVDLKIGKKLPPAAIIAKEAGVRIISKRP